MGFKEGEVGIQQLVVIHVDLILKVMIEGEKLTKR